ncbi:hypothetical protein Acr_10g0009210 [Actinidia rufa]|uniref:DUF8040 domain-containing protein n=1 Tax=Actinidia rufa TaxID=165716 RepID=A0A7J0FAU2_9ERIC|nr:hypothetical protein Acr_10g0009210 [Actinidia rufa]
MEQVFGGMTTTGRSQWTPGEDLPSTTLIDESSGSSDEAPDDEFEVGFGWKGRMPSEEAQRGQKRADRPSSGNKSASGKKKMSAAARLSRTMDKMLEVVQPQGSEVTVKSHADSNNATIGNYLHLLANLPGIDPLSPLYLLGTQLITIPANRDVFMGLPNDDIEFGYFFPCKIFVLLVLYVEDICSELKTMDPYDDSVQQATAAHYATRHRNTNTLMLAVIANVEEYNMRYVDKIPCRTSALTGWAWLMELLSNKTWCHENLRMSRELFLALCGELVNKYRLLVTDKGDCIGAIDGTHVEARLPPEKAVPYFGSMHDTRIFYNVVLDTNKNFPYPQGDKYYLVDAGYPNRKGFLAPYKGERYHQAEFQRESHPLMQMNNLIRNSDRDPYFDRIEDMEEFYLSETTNDSSGSSSSGSSSCASSMPDDNGSNE